MYATCPHPIQKTHKSLSAFPSLHAQIALSDTRPQPPPLAPSIPPTSSPPLLRLHPNLRLLRALPRLRLPAKPLILAHPKPRQLLRILHRAIHPAVPDPQRHADEQGVFCERPDEPDPRHDAAVEHAADLERDPEDGEEAEDGGDVGLRDDLGDERGKVCLEGFGEAVDGGDGADDGVYEGRGEERVQEGEVVCLR